MEKKLQMLEEIVEAVKGECRTAQKDYRNNPYYNKRKGMEKALAIAGYLVSYDTTLLENAITPAQEIVAVRIGKLILEI